MATLLLVLLSVLLLVLFWCMCKVASDADDTIDHASKLSQLRPDWFCILMDCEGNCFTCHNTDCCVYGEVHIALDNNGLCQGCNYLGPRRNMCTHPMCKGYRVVSHVCRVCKYGPNQSQRCLDNESCPDLV
jgi:hypothetical protein